MEEYEIKNIKNSSKISINIIQKGNSLHQENAYSFIIDDKFREKPIEFINNNSCRILL